MVPAISSWNYKAVQFFKKWNGNGSVKLSVCCMISARPSVPKCWVEGGELIGEAVSLHCKSAKGSPPLKYTWRRESAGPIPAAATQSKCDLCWRHNATTHQRHIACVYVCVLGWGLGKGVTLGSNSVWAKFSENPFSCWMNSTCLFLFRHLSGILFRIVKLYDSDRQSRWIPEIMIWEHNTHILLT